MRADTQLCPYDHCDSVRAAPSAACFPQHVGKSQGWSPRLRLQSPAPRGYPAGWFRPRRWPSCQ